MKKKSLLISIAQPNFASDSFPGHSSGFHEAEKKNRKVIFKFTMI
jgi:hypothetical protein